MSILCLSNIDAYIEKKCVLKDVSFDIGCNEIVAIIGPNGAGKSSLISVLSGDLIPVSGSYNLDERPFHSIDANERACRLSVLPQFSALNFPFTVHQVVELGRTPHSTGVKVDERIVQRALKLMDIVYLEHRVYTQLSGGEKQRTHIARALAQILCEKNVEQKYILLDEPTTALDLSHQVLLAKCLKKLLLDNISVVLVVHDVNYAMRVATKIVAIKHSEIHGVGTPGEILQETFLESLFDTPFDLVPHPERMENIIVPR